MTPSKKILLLGTAKDLASAGHATGREVFMPCRVFEKLNEQQIADLAPDVVVSMFVCGALDCLEISQRLAIAGFSGRYYVLVPDVPNPQIIINEITQSCPGIDIRVVTDPFSI